MLVIILIGARGGTETLAITHDIFGTVIAYLNLAGGLWILVRHTVRDHPLPRGFEFTHPLTELQTTS